MHACLPIARAAHYTAPHQTIADLSVTLSTYAQGTKSSKRKKQAKLKRVMATVKKQERRDAASTNESFAAVHLLHDPQAFAERLFARLQGGGERYETRLAMMNVTSR